jgi:hypothetical protein
MHTISSQEQSGARSRTITQGLLSDQGQRVLTAEDIGYLEGIYVLYFLCRVDPKVTFA